MSQLGGHPIAFVYNYVSNGLILIAIKLYISLQIKSRSLNHLDTLNSIDKSYKVSMTLVPQDVPLVELPIEYC